MKTALRNLHWIAMLGLILTAACAAPDNGNAPANNAPAAEAANANAPAAQPATPLTTIPPQAVAPAQPPQPATAQPATAQPATAQPTSPTAARPAEKPAAAPGAGPKLVMLSQERDLDFGKQPQDKTLMRPIRIKNGGTEPLNIESVTPS